MSQILARDIKAQWRQRAEQGAEPRRHKSRWVIDMMRDRLAPEHVSLAQFLCGQQAIAEGRKPSDYDRVDGAGNGAEGSLIARLDAQRLIAGYEGAIFTALSRGGVLCLRAIMGGETMGETIQRCGYAADSHHSVRKLVQLTMINAQEHDDVCRLDRERWNANAVRAQCA